MNQGFIKELETLLSSNFTGTVTLHVCGGCVKQIETNKRWRPKPENGKVELTEGAAGE